MFNYQRLKRTVLASYAACLLAGNAIANDALINNSFHPYKESLPSHPGLPSRPRVGRDRLL